MGRNIWQSERPIPLIEAVRAMIHEDASYEETVGLLMGWKGSSGTA